MGSLPHFLDFTKNYAFQPGPKDFDFLFQIQDSIYTNIHRPNEFVRARGAALGRDNTQSHLKPEIGDFSDMQSQLVLVYKRGAAPSPWCLVGGGEVGQGDDLDGILIAGAMSFAGVVELGPGSPLAFVTVVLWQGPPQSVAALGSGSPAPALLEAKRWQGGVGLLELRQRRRHPAVVGVAEDQALLRAVLRGLGQSFLQVHFDSWRREKHKALSGG